MSAPIDVKHLDQYICGDARLLDEVLSIFEEQALSWVEKLSPVMSDDDWRHAAHALKGASRGVGAWAVGDLAEEAEDLVGPSCDPEARTHLLVRLREKATEAVACARELRDNAFSG